MPFLFAVRPDVPDTGDMLAFSAEQVSVLTGLTERQLRGWDETDFFKPETLDLPHQAHRRIYTFRDVVGLRTIAELKNMGVSTRQLREVGAHLKAEHATPWSALKFWVGHERRRVHVYFSEPVSGRPVKPGPEGRPAMLFALEEVVARLRDDAAKLRERGAKQVGEVVADRHVLGGELRLAGTRIPIAAIWELHDAKYTEAEILREYPQLAPADIRATLAYRTTG